jgi:hypothetical protein
VRAQPQATASSPQGGFDLNPAGAFNSAPFGSPALTVGGTTSRR